MRQRRGTGEFVEPILTEAGLPLSLADALEDISFDALIRSETDEGLSLSGKDVGTPIIHFQPPTGIAFFGPVISRLPDENDSVRLWDHVVGLASLPGFAELKRSLREQPQLAAFGVAEGAVGVREDWHGRSRRLKKNRDTPGPPSSAAGLLGARDTFTDDRIELRRVDPLRPGAGRCARPRQRHHPDGQRSPICVAA